MFKQDAVLVPGEYVFKLEIQSEDVNWKEDGLFVDFLALLPDEYYEPKILKQKVNEPCKYRKQADGKCMMFTHFPLPIGSVVQTYSKHKLPISSNYVIEVNFYFPFLPFKSLFNSDIHIKFSEKNIIQIFK